MKLFQIEEPEGPPLDASGPGAAVGIAVDAKSGAVAVAVGGNAEILPGADGVPFLEEADLAALLLGLRARAEKQLARPVTHAVVAIPPIEAGPLAVAAQLAGLTILEAVDRGTDTIEHAALEAAILAEDLAPKII
jgi:Ethanolamine utilization protein EutJ (predicted chaperonin)